MCHGHRRPFQMGRRLATTACFVLSACVGTIDSPRSWSEAENNGPDGLVARNPDGTPIAGSPLNNAPGASNNPGGSNVPGGATANGSTNPGTAPGGAACNVGSAPMRRLTHGEYNNAVADLLRDSSGPASGFVLDNQIGLFDNSAEAQTVPSLLGDQYMEAALNLADNVKDFRGLMGCDPQATGATGEGCVRSFITSFGRRAYRRPLGTDEQTRLFELYRKNRSAADVPTGVRGIIV